MFISTGPCVLCFLFGCSSGRPWCRHGSQPLDNVRDESRGCADRNLAKAFETKMNRMHFASNWLQRKFEPKRRPILCCLIIFIEYESCHANPLEAASASDDGLSVRPSELWTRGSFTPCRSSWMAKDGHCAASGGSFQSCCEHTKSKHTLAAS